MKYFLPVLALTLIFGISLCFAEGNDGASGFQWVLEPKPVILGLRVDDNVFRSVSIGSQVTDDIYSLDAGGSLEGKYGIFKGYLTYGLTADQYQSNNQLNNLTNDLGGMFALNPGDFSFYYDKNLFIRNDQNYQDFNYVDDDNLFGILWAPKGPWNYGLRYKYYSRQYYSSEDLYSSRNFADQEVQANIQREIDDRLTLKISGSYSDCQFNRFIVLTPDTTSDSVFQHDQTFTAFLGAHLYFESILQDITIEHQRTNSNSYSFSNTIDSVSWAGVFKPIPALYLQLFCRLYSKVYDISPIVSPDLQLGFVDEDSQDLLSAKASWEWSPQWLASIGISRMRVESDQPDQFYIKEMVSFQMRRNF